MNNISKSGQVRRKFFRLIALFLIIVTIAQSSVQASSLKEVSYGDVPEELQEFFFLDLYYEDVYNNYNYYLSGENSLFDILSDRTANAYLAFADDIEQNPQLQKSNLLLQMIHEDKSDSLAQFVFDKSELILKSVYDENLEAMKEKYELLTESTVSSSVKGNMEILIGLMALMENDLTDARDHMIETDSFKSISNLTSQDSWRAILELVWEGAGIAFDALLIQEGLSLPGEDKGKNLGRLVREGQPPYEKTLSPLQEELKDLDFLWDIEAEMFASYKDLNFVNKIFENYKKHLFFLDAVINNTRDYHLKKSAEILKSYTELAFVDKMNTIKDYTTKTAGYSTVKISARLLESEIDTGIFSNILQQLSMDEFVSAKNLKVAKKLGVFAANALVGSSKMAKRVYEMQVLSEIHKALVKDMATYRDAEINDHDKINKAHATLKNLAYINLRGNYCLYAMLCYDSGLFSVWNKLSGDRQSHDEWMETVLANHENIAYSLEEGFYPNLLYYLKDEEEVQSYEEEAEAGQAETCDLETLWRRHLDASGENELDFLKDDFDGDGKPEAFGITGQIDDLRASAYRAAGYDVKIYFISTEGAIALARATSDWGDALYGYLNTPENTPDTPILKAGRSKFISWELCASGSSSISYVFGVREGKVYEPDISGKYMGFMPREEGLFGGTTNDFSQGFHDYIMHYFYFDPESGEFIFMEGSEHSIFD